MAVVLEPILNSLQSASRQLPWCTLMLQQRDCWTLQPLLLVAYYLSLSNILVLYALVCRSSYSLH